MVPRGRCYLTRVNRGGKAWITRPGQPGPNRGPAMIRPTVPADTPHLLDLAQETGVFKPHEIEALQEVLDDYHAENQALDHRAVTDERDGQVVGFAYYAPAAMADRTWYLYWIAVSKKIQAKGVGS